MGSEGREVRLAMDGPDVEHDELISFVSARNREDATRASSAAESRQLIGEYVERTGVNAKALSWARQIQKAANKDQHKAMDIIKSLKVLLAMVEAEVAGQQAEMNLGDDDPVEYEDAPLPPTYETDPEFDRVLANSTLAEDAA